MVAPLAFCAGAICTLEQGITEGRHAVDARFPMTCRNFRFDDCFDDCLEELFDREASEHFAAKAADPKLEQLAAIAARAELACSKGTVSSPYWSAAKLRAVLWQAVLVLLVAGLMVLVGLLTSSSLKRHNLAMPIDSLSARSSAPASVPLPSKASCTVADATASGKEPAPLRRRVFCAFRFAVFADRQELEKALSQPRNP